MKLELIAAVSANGAIGKDGSLPWHIPDELAWFKKATQGKAVIMGRVTWDSLPIKPLPNRLNIVISKQQSNFKGALCASTLDDAIALASGPAIIIGGASIYAQALPFVDTMYLTEIKGVLVDEPFTAFPWFDVNNWDRSIIGEHDLFLIIKYSKKRHP